MFKRIVFIAFLALLVLSANAQTTDSGNEEKKVCAYYFYGSDCHVCAQVTPFLEEFAQQHPELELHSMDIIGEFELIKALYTKYDVPVDKWGHVPIVFIGDKFFLGIPPIPDNFEREFNRFKEKGVECPNVKPTPAEKISIIQLIGLAAVDSVNPCTLAVLLILITAILTRYPDKRRKALKAGLAFSGAVFLMYLFFGLLIILGFKTVLAVIGFEKGWFYPVLGAIAIILGILNLKDAIWYGRGFLMEVPLKWRPQMKAVIKGVGTEKKDEKEEECPGCDVMEKPGVMKHIEGRSTTIGAFIAGLIVSFFLTPCTAGPYFVAGGILATVSWLEAMPYLLLYLLIFILPMLIITTVTYIGFMAVEDVSGWREKNLKKLHLFAGLLLLGLGIALVLGLL